LYINIERTSLPGVLTFEPKKFADDRGYFMEIFRQNKFENAVNHDVKFVQENHSYSAKSGTLRGLHYQSPPFEQGKLVRCTRGRINDIAVDIRRGSPHLGQHVRVDLSEENGIQLWIPPGFLHGFVTLEDNTEVSYKCTNYYDAESDGTIRWNDPELKVDWGVDLKEITLSDKDKAARFFQDFNTPFEV
jgi:dTDP-4-dehydrorhamnose 3,5-epimerase